MADTPLSAQMESDYKVAKWNRNTVADGSWLQKYTIEKLKDRDIFLANNIDSATGDLTSALDAEKAARIEGDEYISAALTSVSSDFYDFSGKVEQSASDLNSALNTEVIRATAAETDLQEQIDVIEMATDVVDVVGTHDELEAYDKPLTKGDIIKVLVDEYYDDLETYWRVVGEGKKINPPFEWTYVGTVTPYYSKSKINNFSASLSSTISSTYLSANETAIIQGKNIDLTFDENNPYVTIATQDDVSFSNVTADTASGTSAIFTGVSAQGLTATDFSGTNISGVGKSSTISGLISSAESGALANSILNSAYWSANNNGTSAGSGLLKNSFSISAGENIFITGQNDQVIGIKTDDNVEFSSVSSTEFSGTNISSLNLYIPSANNGARFISEISSNSTGISAHKVGEFVNEIVTASWDSIINAANNPHEYVPLSAEECKIGDNNSASNCSLAQGSVNSATNFAFAQGSDNTVKNNAFAQGINNSAENYSIAQGFHNSAMSDSIAQGYNNSARNYSLAFGKNSQAYQGGFAFSPDLWAAQTKPSLASGNSFAFGNGCTAEINAFAMGDNCSAVSGGFAYGVNCKASSNSIAIGEGMFSKEKQISLGYYGKTHTATTNKIVFHVGYGSGPETSSRKDVFAITSAGTIISYDTGDTAYNPQKEAVKLDSQFFQAPREFGRRIPMRLSQGLSMATGENIDVKTYPDDFSARYNILFGDDAEGYSFNMWIPSTTGSASQEFKLTKASCAHRGVYKLTVGVHKSYSIMFKNFNPNTGSQTDRTVIKTGVANTGSWPAGGTTAYYDNWNFFLDKDSANLNTYFNFPVIPCDDIITFIVDGATKQFIMIKGQG